MRTKLRRCRFKDHPSMRFAFYSFLASLAFTIAVIVIVVVLPVSA